LTVLVKAPRYAIVFITLLDGFGQPMTFVIR